MEQAEEDAKEGEIPVVLLREDGDTRFFVLVELTHIRTLAAKIARIGELP
jgi:hypothetical protein